MNAMSITNMMLAKDGLLLHDWLDMAVADVLILTLASGSSSSEADAMTLW